MLREKHLTLNSFSELRKLAPLRQIEAAELMIAMNNFSNSYVCSLVAATPVGYVSKLLRNGRVVGYLAKRFQELLFEFQRITERRPTRLSFDRQK